MNYFQNKWPDIQKLSICLCFVLFMLIQFAFTANAKVWQTQSSGFWSQTNVWLGSIVPSFSTVDTFYINHPLVLDANLNLNASAFLRIDANGGLCGHKEIDVMENARIENYGILECDILNIHFGTVVCYSPAMTQLTEYAHVSGIGAQFYIQSGASLSVGGWFDCIMPEYFFTMSAGLAPVNTSAIEVFPNPSKQAFYIKIHSDLMRESGLNFELYDLNARLILVIKLTNYITSLSSELIVPGMYYGLLKDKDQNLLETKKLVMLD